MYLTRLDDTITTRRLDLKWQVGRSLPIFTGPDRRRLAPAA